MTWEIVVGIIALVTFVGAIATWTGKLVKTLTSLADTIKVIQDAAIHDKKDNKAAHDYFGSRIREQQETLRDHENRIKSVER